MTLHWDSCATCGSKRKIFQSTGRHDEFVHSLLADLESRLVAMGDRVADPRTNRLFGTGEVKAISAGSCTRVCWDSSGVYHGCGEMAHRGEALIGLVGAHCDAFELLELDEEVLD